MTKFVPRAGHWLAYMADVRPQSEEQIGWLTVAFHACQLHELEPNASPTDVLRYKARLQVFGLNAKATDWVLAWYASAWQNWQRQSCTWHGTGKLSTPKPAQSSSSVSMPPFLGTNGNMASISPALFAPGEHPYDRQQFPSWQQWLSRSHDALYKTPPLLRRAIAGTLWDTKPIEALNSYCIAHKLRSKPGFHLPVTDAEIQHSLSVIGSVTPHSYPRVQERLFHVKPYAYASQQEFGVRVTQGIMPKDTEYSVFRLSNSRTRVTEHENSFRPYDLIDFVLATLLCDTTNIRFRDDIIEKWLHFGVCGRGCTAFLNGAVEENVQQSIDQWLIDMYETSTLDNRPHNVNKLNERQPLDPRHLLLLQCILPVQGFLLELVNPTTILARHIDANVKKGLLIHIREASIRARDTFIQIDLSNVAVDQYPHVAPHVLSAQKLWATKIKTEGCIPVPYAYLTSNSAKEANLPAPSIFEIHDGGPSGLLWEPPETVSGIGRISLLGSTNFL